MKTQLIISTETFPYGKGEKSFILPELERLVDKYDITIVSHASKELVENKEFTTKLDSRIKVVNVELVLNIFQQICYGIRYLFDVDGWKEIINILKSKEQVIARIYQSLGFYALAMENYRLMKKKQIINSEKDAIYYSFWFYYYTYSMTKNKDKYDKLKVITRTHGFDLYHERYTGKRQPFKEIMNVNIDKIIFISEVGKRYYEDLYGCNDEKYIVNRLGIKQREFIGDKVEDNQSFQLVSCSSIIPLKRVELIIDALALTEEENINWIHFGDGTEEKRIKKYAENKLGTKQNIRYQLKGFMPNEEVIEYYKTHWIDCFITTSSTEGIPVSIQEAMAIGIPVIGTCVGGIPEMIEQNGILVSENPEPMEIYNAICKIYYLSEDAVRKMRRESYKIWKNKFWDEINNQKFLEILETLK